MLRTSVTDLVDCPAPRVRPAGAWETLPRAKSNVESMEPFRVCIARSHAALNYQVLEKCNLASFARQTFPCIHALAQLGPPSRSGHFIHWLVGEFQSNLLCTSGVRGLSGSRAGEQHKSPRLPRDRSASERDVFIFLRSSHSCLSHISSRNV